jgi:hypothetical protein
MIEDVYARESQAVRRLRNEVWSRATGLSRWTGQEPAKPDQQLTIVGAELSALVNIGAPLDGLDVWEGTRLELWTMLKRHTAGLMRQSWTAPVTDPKLEGTDIPDFIKTMRQWTDDNGYDPDDPYTWPEEALAEVRKAYGSAIDAGHITLNEYRTELAPRYGLIDYEPPQPPPIQDTEFHFNVEPWRVEVIDGDTVGIDFPDGTRQRVRLIGINAAEDYRNIPELHEVWLTQREELRTLLDNADEVSFAVFDTERFATLQELVGDDVRWLMWLYVDGKPVWSPESFTSVNPTGILTGGPGVSRARIGWSEVLEGVS